MRLIIRDYRMFSSVLLLFLLKESCNHSMSLPYYELVMLCCSQVLISSVCLGNDVCGYAVAFIADTCSVLMMCLILCPCSHRPHEAYRSHQI